MNSMGDRRGVDSPRMANGSPRRDVGRSRSPGDGGGAGGHRGHRVRSFSRSRSRDRGGERRSYRRNYRSRSRDQDDYRERYKSYRGGGGRSHSRSPGRRGGGGRHMGGGGGGTRVSPSFASAPDRPRYSSRSYDNSMSRGSSGRFLQQEAPGPNKCLGVFGLSLRTTERDLREVFTRYGPIDECTVVIDAQTGRSRGFAFIYFEALEDAKAAKESCNGIEIDGRRIRVDFSITQRAHTPTPGIYMGKPTRRREEYRGYRRSPSPYYRERRRRHSRSRSYSPRGQV